MRNVLSLSWVLVQKRHKKRLNYLTAQGEKVGVVTVRLYRPFSVEAFLGALPATTKSIAVLDRTKEPGATGEPLYLDVVTAVAQAMARRQSPPSTSSPKFSGVGTVSLPKNSCPAWSKPSSTKRLNPVPRTASQSVSTTMLPTPAWNGMHPLTLKLTTSFVVSSTVSVPTEPSAPTKTPSKSSVKIPDNYAQAYFVYDSKKAGSVTMSHLRFGPRPIRAPYLVNNGELCGLPPVQLPGTVRHAEQRQTRCNLLAQQPLRPR